MCSMPLGGKQKTLEFITNYVAKLVTLNQESKGPCSMWQLNTAHVTRKIHETYLQHRQTDI